MFSLVLKSYRFVAALCIYKIRFEFYLLNQKFTLANPHGSTDQTWMNSHLSYSEKRRLISAQTVSGISRISFWRWLHSGVLEGLGIPWS